MPKERGRAMNTYRLLGIGCGILVGFLFVAFFMKLTKKDGSMKCKFDERQEVVRGQGYKYGFFSLVIYNVAYGILADFGIADKIDVFAVMFIGIGVGILVYASYCIWNEGYISLNENPKRVMAGFVLIALFNLLIGLRNAFSGEFAETGEMGLATANIWAGVVFVILVLEILAKQISNRREAE